MPVNSFECRGWVKGLSMWPNLIPGDILQVAECRSVDLKPGMIAVFPGNGKEQFIVHRVVRARNSFSGVVVTSAGDWSGIDNERSHFKHDDIVKKVTGVLRKGRYRSVTRFHVYAFLSRVPLSGIYCGIVRRFFW
jgi:hypothetical protein